MVVVFCCDGTTYTLLYIPGCVFTIAIFVCTSLPIIAYHALPQSRVVFLFFVPDRSSAVSFSGVCGCHAQTAASDPSCRIMMRPCGSCTQHGSAGGEACWRCDSAGGWMYRESRWSVLVVSVGQNGPAVGSAYVSWRGCDLFFILFHHDLRF